MSYGTKAFPNVALMRLFAEEGIGADVSTLGELRFALAAGIGGERLVVHGNNKSDDELRAAAAVGALVVLDSLEEVERARGAGIGRTLIRVTPGSRPTRTRRSGRATTARSSGCRPPTRSRRFASRPTPRGCTSTSAHSSATRRSRMAVDWLATFAAGAREETAGSRGRSTSAAAGRRLRPRRRRTLDRRVRARRCWPSSSGRSLHALAAPRVILEPGRSLVARAGVTLYTVGSVKRAAARRPTSRSTAACPTTPAPRSTGRATPRCSRTAPDEPPPGRTRSSASIASRGPADRPRRAAGASPRRPPRGADDRRLHARDELELQRRAPPGGGPGRGRRARVIRRRETIDDLLALET